MTLAIEKKSQDLIFHKTKLELLIKELSLLKNKMKYFLQLFIISFFPCEFKWVLTLS